MSSGCPGLDAFNPLCQLTSGVGSSIVGSGISAIFSAFANWVASGATWLLGQVGSVIDSTTSVNLTAGWFTSHYRVMLGLLGIVVLPLFLVATMQAVYRQSASGLIRSLLVQVPLGMLLAGVAVQLVQLGLSLTDTLSSSVAAGSGQDLHTALASVADALSSSGAGAAVPAFVLVLASLLVAFGAFLLWLELLVRAAAVYVAVLFLPLVLATLVWPAISHWCRRLVETLVALVLSKFVIVAILSLAAGAISASGQSQSSGGGAVASVLAGGALLLLAATSPFTLLRLVPLIEAGAVHQLEGARHRVQQAFGSAPRSALQLALAQTAGAPELGMVGTGESGVFEPPGPGGGLGASDGAGVTPGAPAAPGASGLPEWEGTPYEEDTARQWVEAGGSPPTYKGIKPVIGVAPGTDRGKHVIGRDHVGPQIKWIPPAADPEP